MVVLLLFTQAAISSIETAKPSPSTKTTSFSSSQMSLEDLAGQVLMIGFKGTQLTPDLKSHLRVVRPGGLILFGRNIKSPTQTLKLTTDLQLFARELGLPPFLIAIDQEGGVVTRIKSFPMLPSAMSIGNTGDPRVAHRLGRLTGDILSAFGVNMNLAPVADIGNDSQISFIGTRAFAETAPVVARMVTGYARGLSQAGVIPTAKHFPGHGADSSDSHVLLPSRDVRWDELLEQDLVPFASLHHAGALPAVLIAHVAFPQIDSTGTPATFSKEILEGRLRGQLGYKGVTLSDDLEMAGAQMIRDPSVRARKALEAGIDISMIGWHKATQAASRLSILSWASSSPEGRARLMVASQRILDLKKKYLVNPIPQFRPAHDLASLLANPPLLSLVEGVVRSNAERAFQMRRFESIKAFETVIVATASPRFYQDLLAASKHSRLHLQRLTRRHTLEDNQTLNRRFPNARWIYYVTGPITASLLHKVPRSVRQRMIVVNTLTPGNVRNRTEYQDVIDLFTRYTLMGRLLAPSLFEEAKSNYESFALRESNQIIDVN